MVKTKTYPEFSDSCIKVLNRRYLVKDAEGNVTETPDDMFRRVANNLAKAELNYPEAFKSINSDPQVVEDDFYDLMRSLDFLPNTPTLVNAGRELQQLSACFVLPVGDSMEEIFEAVKNTALIHKSGGGTGFSFSRLRPAGDHVMSTSGIASGAVSFINVFDSATEVVKQGGTRRGANMAVLRVDHPDIMEFITSKADGTRFQNFNISVAITESWMDQVEKGEDYHLYNPHTQLEQGTLNAREVFNKICEMAWKTGDPGLWYIDRVNRTNPNSHLGDIESCNPCGEQELMPNESCTLGSINLLNHIDIGRTSFDWEKLKSTSQRALHLLDNVLDMTAFPTPEVEEMSRSTRRVGVGVMGWADALIALGIPYDSSKSIDLGKQVMSWIQENVHEASQELSKTRGCYPAWEGSSYYCNETPMRNTSPVTIAPTGTISIIAGVSSGIEPIFALAFKRTVMEGTVLVETNLQFSGFCERLNIPQEVIDKVAETGSIKDLDFTDTQKAVYITSHDLPVDVHIKMQSVFQESTDNAVSKTINLHNEATVEDIANAYWMAFYLQCKGITVYRDGSKENQVLSTGLTKFGSNDLFIRPARLDGYTDRLRSGHGNIYITLNHFDGEIVEVIAATGKAGGCDSAQMEAVTRMVTLCLQSHVPLAEIISQLRGITCCPVWDQGVQIMSGPDAIARSLLAFAEHHHTPDHNIAVPHNGGLKCPDCNSKVIFETGCPKCIDCGWSKC